jgi:hypothetical protein
VGREEYEDSEDDYRPEDRMDHMAQVDCREPRSTFSSSRREVVETMRGKGKGAGAGPAVSQVMSTVKTESASTSSDYDDPPPKRAKSVTPRRRRRQPRQRRREEALYMGIASLREYVQNRSHIDIRCG